MGLPKKNPRDTGRVSTPHKQPKFAIQSVNEKVENPGRYVSTLEAGDVLQLQFALTHLFQDETSHGEVLVGDAIGLE